jgi:hypothetical protein
MSFKTLNFTRNITKAILMASLAVSFVAPPANAQYMVIDGVSASPNAFKEPVCCQTIYVQDYSNFSGINDSDKGNELTSTAMSIAGIKMHVPNAPVNPSNKLLMIAVLVSSFPLSESLIPLKLL